MAGRRRGSKETFDREGSKEKEIQDNDEKMSHAVGAQVQGKIFQVLAVFLVFLNVQHTSFQGDILKSGNFQVLFFIAPTL